ncbi:hypothetical protein BDF21DRAFT_34509 [Thamnidium elegans]|nr:hypothetical protein BDF21DRAFT_34509 [Thamnidium elegans]
MDFIYTTVLQCIYFKIEFVLYNGHFLRVIYSYLFLDKVNKFLVISKLDWDKVTKLGHRREYEMQKGI